MKKIIIKTPEEILEEKIDKIHRRREWRHFLFECIILIAAVFVVFQYVIGITFVSGESMEPTLMDRELVVFYRLDQEYRKGDIVLIRKGDNLEYMKRITAVEGETVEQEVESEALTVPENCVYVLGDNLEKSRDSREFGFIKESEIVGRVFLHVGMVK